MNRAYEDALKLGALAENLVKKFLKGELSENTYDYNKDGNDLEGKTFEVKCQTAISKNGEEYLSINADQAAKCLTVDRLIFVYYNDTPSISILEVTERNNFLRYSTKHGDKKVAWKIKEMTALITFDNVSLSNQFRSYSNAYYRFRPLRGLKL